MGMRWTRWLSLPLLWSALAIGGLAPSWAAAQPGEWERPPEPEPPPLTPRGTFDETWFPEHPGAMVEASAGVSVAPLGRTLMLDVDAELASGLALGARGTFAHCEHCNFSADSFDGAHDVGVAYAYAGWSRPNFMFGGTMLLAHGQGLESGVDRFGYGAGFLLRIGRVDGLRLDTGFGIVVSPPHHRSLSGAIVLHDELRVPLFGRGVYRVALEARSEFTIIDPFFWIPSVGLRVRTGPVVFGLRAHFVMAQAASAVLWVGYRADSLR